MTDDTDSPLRPYLSFDEMTAEVRSLADAHPDVHVSEIGRSVDDRPILGLHIEPQPGMPGVHGVAEVLVAANIHGNEFIGNRMAVAVARRLVGDAGRDAWIASLRRILDVWIVPCINPDGYARTWDSEGTGKFGECRKNSNGVDLNRNFPLPGRRTVPIPWAGSNNPDSTNYCGPETLSEPETRAIVDFAARRKFVAAIDCHSFGGIIFRPKTPSRRVARIFDRFGRALKARQRYVRYIDPNNRFLDTFTGEMEDYLLYEHGTVAVCLEIGRPAQLRVQHRKDPRMFWRMNPKDIGRWVANDRDAILAALEEGYYLTEGRPLDFAQK